jgi:hypothetical protein
MMIPKYLPLLFADNPLSPEETALLTSLGVRSSTEYERLIEQFALQLDMRNEMIRTRLKGFETAYERERAREVSENLECFRREYQIMLDTLRSKLNTIQEQEIFLAGLQCKLDGEHQSELMEYFLCNKNLSIIQTRGTQLEFVAHGYADVYDEDAFETYVNNPNSYLYNNIRDSVTKEGLQRLYLAIFGGGGYKLRICAAYRADMRNSVTPLQNYTYPPESQTYLPNPHIQYYGCIGGYAQRFTEYMRNKDYVGAIDQAVVSARNLNFHDSTVMSRFAYHLSRTPIKCIEDTNGNLMTPKEAIKRLEVAECPSP